MLMHPPSHTAMQSAGGAGAPAGDVADALLAAGVSDADTEAVAREFLARAKTAAGGDGVPRLDRATCRAVFASIGVTDAGVANRMFDAWDVDRTGSIDLKEFVHALMLSRRGSHHDKLALAFTVMDTDADGRVSKPELMRFLRTVSTLNGAHVNVLAAAAEVDAMFAAAAPADLGFLTFAEFRALASNTRYALGERLERFFTNFQAKLASGLAAPPPPPAPAAPGAPPPLFKSPSAVDNPDFADYRDLRDLAASAPSSPAVASAAAATDAAVRVS